MLKIETEDQDARAGLLKINGRTIKTPFFMPVATRAVGKYIGTDDYKAIQSKAIICNSFVLSMNPGVSTIQKLGGIHDYMNFPGVIFSDCGGFQISRDSFFIKTTDKGIMFKNPQESKKELLTPQKAIDTQTGLGVDCMMALDDMQPYGSEKEKFQEALVHTHDWAEQSIKYYKQEKEHIQDKDQKQALFGIIQGGFFKDLREESAQFMTKQDFDGISVGGLAIGETRQEMYEVLDWTMPIVQKNARNKVHYLMGLGSPLDILECIGRGFDCFDSVYPTKNARHSTIFTRQGSIAIDKQQYKEDSTPLDKECGCPVCKNYTKAYIYYLSKLDEPIAKRYKSIHNLFFMHQLVNDARIAIEENGFEKFKKEFMTGFAGKK
jgi:queuine tRNA-ribosyltransferase